MNAYDLFVRCDWTKKSSSTSSACSQRKTPISWCGGSRPPFATVEASMISFRFERSLGS